MNCKFVINLICWEHIEKYQPGSTGPGVSAGVGPTLSGIPEPGASAGETLTGTPRTANYNQFNSSY